MELIYWLMTVGEGNDTGAFPYRKPCMGAHLQITWREIKKIGAQVSWNGDVSILQHPWNKTHKCKKISSSVIDLLVNFDWVNKYSVTGRESGIKTKL